MAIDSDRIIFIGLAALYEVAERSRAAPVQPCLMLRATLAALYAHSDGNRAPYEAFWLSCQDSAAFAFSEAQGAYSRGTATTTAWNRIALGLGVTPSVDYMAAIYREVHPGKATARSGIPHLEQPANAKGRP